MNSDISIALIGVGGTLLGTVLGTVLGWFLNWLSQKGRVEIRVEHIEFCSSDITHIINARATTPEDRNKYIPGEIRSVTVTFNMINMAERKRVFRDVGIYFKGMPDKRENNIRIYDLEEERFITCKNHNIYLTSKVEESYSVTFPYDSSYEKYGNKEQIVLSYISESGKKKKIKTKKINFEDFLEEHILNQEKLMH